MSYIINKGFDSEEKVEGPLRLDKRDDYSWFSDDRSYKFVIAAERVITIEWTERVKMSNDYATAWDSLAQTIGAAKGASSGYINEIDHLTIDQRLKVAEISALLSIAQELSDLNPRNHK